MFVAKVFFWISLIHVTQSFHNGFIRSKFETKLNDQVDKEYYASNISSQRSVPTRRISHIQNVPKVTLTRYLSGLVQEKPELREMESLLLSVSMACKTISNLINRGNINQYPSISTSTTNMQQNSMKKLDQLSTQVLRNALRFTGKVSTITPARQPNDLENEEDLDNKPAEHQPGVLIASGENSKYVAFFDPLDGSKNADATICTGTIFGMFPSQGSSKNDFGVLQPGKNLRAAGYCIYSSATILVFSVGDGTHGFTLDSQLGEFVLTHPNIRIPPRGTIYSCNEANSETWPDSTQKFLNALKSGNNQSQKRYTQRYIGSMVGDIHRTLMYGGVFFYPEDKVMHPRGNLQLLYKSAPLAYLVNQAGGDSSNGDTDLLDVIPTRVHERSPCYIGSKDDIAEMKTY